MFRKMYLTKWHLSRFVSISSYRRVLILILLRVKGTNVSERALYHMRCVPFCMVFEMINLFRSYVESRPTMIFLFRSDVGRRSTRFLLRLFARCRSMSDAFPHVVRRFSQQIAQVVLFPFLCVFLF
jgi:hypothetical protein